MVETLKLHFLGYAHNDMSLEHIGFNKSSGKPILIDLERSQELSTIVDSDMFGNSTIYTVQYRNWKHDQLNFKQFLLQ